MKSKKHIIITLLCLLLMLGINIVRPYTIKEKATMQAVVEAKHMNDLVISSFQDYRKYKIKAKIYNIFDFIKVEEGDFIIITIPEKYPVADYEPKAYIPAYDIKKSEEQYTLIRDTDGCLIHVLSKNKNFIKVYNNIKALDCGITDKDYQNKELCTHPRGIYENQNMRITIVSEPHIHMTYRIDLYDKKTTATSRIYIQQEDFNKVLEIIKKAEIPYIKEA